MGATTIHTVETKDVPQSTTNNTRVVGWGWLVWRRFRRHRLAMIGSVILLVLVLLALLAPWIAPFDPAELHLQDVPDGKPLPPNTTYWFGTDALGRDYFSRALYGGRVSLSVGLVSVGIAMLIGIPLGCIAGYYGGKVDTAISRLIDLMLCIPTFFLILTVNALLTPSIFNIMIILGVFGWMTMARQARAQFLSLKPKEFVQAAAAIGQRDRPIIFGHILPNALAPLVVAATIGVANAILTESTLSYLGLGVQEPASSWGSMLRTAQSYLTSAPWLAIFPGVLISLVVLALNFIGDGLRDALDPRSKAR